MDSKAFVTDYDFDLFVSYARVDDATADPEARGWVGQLQDHLHHPTGQRDHLQVPVTSFRLAWLVSARADID